MRVRAPPRYVFSQAQAQVGRDDLGATTGISDRVFAGGIAAPCRTSRRWRPALTGDIGVAPVPPGARSSPAGIEQPPTREIRCFADISPWPVPRSSRLCVPDGRPQPLQSHPPRQPATCGRRKGRCKRREDLTGAASGVRFIAAVRMLQKRIRFLGPLLSPVASRQVASFWTRCLGLELQLPDEQALIFKKSAL